MRAGCAGPRFGWWGQTAQKIASDDAVAACIDRLVAGQIIAIKGIAAFT